MTKHSSIAHRPSSIAAPEIQMARQLSEQYQRAVGGLWEVVKFGAMMMHLNQILSPRLQGKFSEQGDGTKAWLAEHCPDIKISTAWRFKGLAEGLQKEFKLGEPADLHRLLTASEDDLNRADRKTREQISEFLEGQSQRQLQFRFASGKGEAPRTPRGPNKEIDLRKQCCRDLASACDFFLKMRGNLPNEYFDTACARILKTLEEATSCRWAPDPDKERTREEWKENGRCYEA